MARPQARRGQGRARVLAAALELISRHGVSGTSLQMIADHLGVGKAAVYYQFRAKEGIGIAVVEPAFAAIRAAIDRACAAGSPQEATEIVIDALIELFLDQRAAMAAVYRDPEVRRIVDSHEEFQALARRLAELAQGPTPDTRRRVAFTVLASGMATACVDAHLADLDDAALRTEFHRLARVALTATEARPAPASPAGRP